jgi:hypothetical protein
MGKAFSQVILDGAVYQSFSNGFFCEKLTVDKLNTKRKKDSLIIVSDFLIPFIDYTDHCWLTLAVE